MNQSQVVLIEAESRTVAPADEDTRTRRSQLHLVDVKGDAVSPAIKSAVELVFRWVARDFPNVDPAMIAEWAEEVGWTMNRKGNLIVAHDRYAYKALRGKVHDWLRTRAAKEEPIGIGEDLESLGALDISFEGNVDRKLLFEQLKASLNERDRYILVLLLRDETSPAITAKGLGISYATAAKAIQRVKERIAALIGNSGIGPGRDSSKFCETKG